MGDSLTMEKEYNNFIRELDRLLADEISLYRADLEELDVYDRTANYGMVIAY